MDSERNIRINKVLRELNISLEKAVDILKSGGFEIESNPNSKINQFEFNFLKYRLNIPVIVEKPMITTSGTISRVRNKLGIPQTVFKYFGTENYHFESLTKANLFYSNYKNFNDPEWDGEPLEPVPTGKSSKPLLVKEDDVDYETPEDEIDKKKTQFFLFFLYSIRSI
jgi:hypothetical protein